MEKDFADYLKMKGIIFQEQVTFNLMEKFEKNGINYRKIDYKTDFLIGKTAIDIKGFVTADFAIKKKLFENKYRELELVCVTVTPSWIRYYFKHDWIELEFSKKLKKIEAAFRKKYGYKKIILGRVTPELVKKVRNEIKFYEIKK